MRPMSITARHLANLAPRRDVVGDALGEAVEALGDQLARAEGQRLGAGVDLDAGQRARRLDDLGQRRAVLGLLADGLVVEDHAGDVILHGLGGAEQHLAVVAAAVGGALGLDRVEALLDGAGALVGGQDALARGHHGLCDLLQRHRFRHGSVSAAIFARACCPWHTANAAGSEGVSSPQPSSRLTRLLAPTPVVSLSSHGWRARPSFDGLRRRLVFAALFSRPL